MSFSFIEKFTNKSYCNILDGLDVIQGKVSDISVNEIVEPLAVKEQVINAACEASSMIVRIDNVIASNKSKTRTDPSSGSMGDNGMSGIPDM